MASNAGIVYTGLKGTSRGDDSGGAKFLGSAPDIKNPYEDLTAQVLAQQGRDRLARQQEKQKAKEVVDKYSDGLVIKNYQDQYATKAAEKVINQSNTLGKLYSEPDGATKAFQQAKIYEAENLAESEKAKRTYDIIDKWTADGAKLVQEDTLGKYDKERYASKMDEMNKLLEAGDFSAVEKFVTDPNNTPLVAKVDPQSIIKNYIQPKRKDMRDGSQVFDEDAAMQNFEIFLNNEDSPEMIDALIKTGYGKDAAEVEKNLMDQARLTPIYPAPTKSSSGDGSGSGASAKVNIVTDTLDTQGLAQDGLPNIARVNRLGTQDDLPPIGITSQEGKKINFQPLEFVVNDKTGKIGVSGLKFAPKTGNDLVSQIAALEQAKQDKLEGKPISQEAKDAGVEETWVDYNRNRTAFEAQTGVDMYKRLGRTDPDKAKGGSKAEEKKGGEWEETKTINGKTYGRKGSDWYEI